MRNYLDSIGYESFPWGQGRNLGPRFGMGEMANRLTDLIFSIYKSAGGQQVSVIGWSLGGIYAREIAKICPEIVRQVITLGTPFKFDNGKTHAERLYEFLSKDTSYKDPETIKQIGEPPPVPFTSIYSKTDGVVPWKASIEDAGPYRENIEVPGASHLGLGHNPIAMYLIADRLTQQKETWKPFSI
jgi:pimeloyl-ACP methyl ester carboxylesterase